MCTRQSLTRSCMPISLIAPFCLQCYMQRIYRPLQRKNRVKDMITGQRLVKIQRAMERTYQEYRCMSTSKANLCKSRREWRIRSQSTNIWPDMWKVYRYRKWAIRRPPGQFRRVRARMKCKWTAMWKKLAAWLIKEKKITIISKNDLRQWLFYL